LGTRTADIESRHRKFFSGTVKGHAHLGHLQDDFALPTPKTHLVRRQPSAQGSAPTGVAGVRGKARVRIDNIGRRFDN
jgi:hypothetical protein